MKSVQYAIERDILLRVFESGGPFFRKRHRKGVLLWPLRQWHQNLMTNKVVTLAGGSVAAEIAVEPAVRWTCCA